MKLSGADMGETGARAPYLGLAAIGMGAVLLVAVYESFAPSLAALAGMVLLGLGVFLALPRGSERRNALGAVPAPEASALPAPARKVLECIDEPLLVLDPSGRVVFANSASQAIFGGDAERKHISKVLRNPEVLEAVERVLTGGDAENVSFGFLVPVQRYYRAYVARNAIESGGSLIVVHIRDLTALRRAEELRADFVANASHELRTPLAAVSGFIDTLKGHAKDDSEARERFLDIMSVEAGRMRRLIDDLLSLTRIELNEHNPPIGIIDVAGVVRDAAAVLSPLAEADGITVRIAPHGPLHVVGDRDELTQVFQNLIHNAIKYGRDKGEVRVAFGDAELQGGRNSRQIFVSVEDEGEGIPREAIPRLTERFYRVDIKRSRERGGTGLGLAIVKHILNRHQGRLAIESAPGEGSKFTVFLPAAQARPAAPEATQ